MKENTSLEAKKHIRCAIYTRKSSEEGLEQDFNSLDAQRGACAAYVMSQTSQGWSLLPQHYDDGGLSGGTLERPALQKLLEDVKDGQIDIIVVYKVDRLTRSLLDFAKLVEAFDEAEVSFVSVTQSFNTTNSMGRLTLNMLLSFAQFEREVTAERIRDKIAQSKARGMWMGGTPPLGYKPGGRNDLLIVKEHAALIRDIYGRYMRLGNVRHLAEELERERVHAPLRTRRNGSTFGGCAFTRGQLYHILKNPIYAGDIPHKDKVYPGNHQAIIARDEWDAVQARLAEHVRGVRKIRMASKALLAGKLFDHEGEPLIPVHTSKPASGEASPSRKRYRYYVTRQAHHDAGTALPALRIPAQEIEDAVRKELAKLLTDPLDIADRAQVDVLPDSFAAFASRCNALHHTILGGKKRAVRKLLKRVEVHSDRLILMLDISTLAELTELSAAPQTPATLTYAVKLSLTRTGHVLKLIDESGAPYAAQPDPALTGLLAQAHQWWGELAQGDIDIANLSRREGVTASWITRVVRLALLAPQVTVAILHGKQRATIDATTILKPNAISPEWEAQREVFLGF